MQDAMPPDVKRRGRSNRLASMMAATTSGLERKGKRRQFLNCRGAEHGVRSRIDPDRGRASESTPVKIGRVQRLMESHWFKLTDHGIASAFVLALFGFGFTVMWRHQQETALTIAAKKEVNARLAALAFASAGDTFGSHRLTMYLD